MDLFIFTPSDGGLKLSAVADDYTSLKFSVSFTDAAELLVTTHASARSLSMFAAGNAVSVPDSSGGVGGLYFIERTKVYGDGRLEVYARGALYLFDRLAYRRRIRQSMRPGALLCSLAVASGSVIPGTLIYSGADVGAITYFDHDYESVYWLMRRICIECGCGMKLSYDVSAGAFEFSALAVSDMSVSQSILPHLVLSRERGNLTDASLEYDLRNYYNAAVVYGCENSNGGRYSVTVGDDVVDDRRELLVSAFNTSINAYATTENGVVTCDESAYLDKLEQIGKQALLRHTPSRKFTAALAGDTAVDCGTKLSYIFAGETRDGIVRSSEISIEGGRRAQIITVI